MRRKYPLLTQGGHIALALECLLSGPWSVSLILTRCPDFSMAGSLPVNCKFGLGDGFDLRTHEITISEFSVDCEVEHNEIAETMIEL